MCINNQCTTNALAPSSVSCVSNNDQMIFQSTVLSFSLPYSPMTCDSYFNFLYTNTTINNNLGCSNPVINEICCNACLSNQVNLNFEYK